MGPPKPPSSCSPKPYILDDGHQCPRNRRFPGAIATNITVNSGVKIPVQRLYANTDDENNFGTSGGGGDPEWHGK